MDHEAINNNRRSRERKNLTTPIRARFKLEFEGEITNISPEGLAVSFSVNDQSTLSKGRPMTLHLDMNGRMVSLEGHIRQVSEKQQTITVGVAYDRAHLAVFQPNKSDR